MAQQARPKVIGHMLDSRAQLMACSSEVVMTLSSNRPSSQPMKSNPFEQNRGLTKQIGYQASAAAASASDGAAAGDSPGDGARSAATLRTQSRSPRRHR